MNRCHVCGDIAVHSDAALCLTCSGRADRGEIVYDPDRGWCQVLPGQCAAPEVALPPGCDIEVSAVREGSG
jgi:hypothetical protein